MGNRELVLRPRHTNLNAYLVFTAFLLELGALFFFLESGHMTHQLTLQLWLPFGLALLGIAFLIAVYEMTDPVKLPSLELTDTFIFDPRLGLGRIYWSDVKDVYTELSYRHRSICLKVSRPEDYIAKLAPSRRANAIVQHQLGFSRLTIDLRPYEVDPIFLRAQISSYIEKNESGATREIQKANAVKNAR